MRQKIRLIVIFGTVSLIGLIITQIYWLQRAYDLQEKKIDQSIQVALINVAEDLARVTKVSSPNPNPVVQLSTDYYVVNINDKIDANVLEHYLLIEFQRASIDLDFEYGIYDCENDQIVYGNFIPVENSKRSTKIGVDLPTYEEYIYYFGVRFPSKEYLIAGNIKYWLFSSFILIIVILFFSVTLYIILKQKRISDFQTDFINNMTHEFKTPISTIKVSTEVLSNDVHYDNPERIKKYIDIIAKENMRLEKQVETILNMADIEKNTAQLNKTTIDVHAILREFNKQIALRIKEKGGNLTFQFQALNPIIEADLLHFKNVISNLLDNAIKYSYETIDIVIKTETKNDSLLLSIMDNGIGIAKEHQKQLFQKFYRVPKGNTNDVKGFGLGLNYVWNVVKNHGWKVSIDSSQGKGSCIKILIPQ
jgi:two-component system phosphate regulon sensor histidine kinase PhoR